MQSRSLFCSALLTMVLLLGCGSSAPTADSGSGSDVPISDGPPADHTPGETETIHPDSSDSTTEVDHPDSRDAGFGDDGSGGSDVHVDAGVESPSVHGCNPQENSPACGGFGTTCTSMHSCCAGVGSDCLVRIATADSGVVLTHAHCTTDDECATTEYCQSRTQCCPIGYTCDLTDGSPPGQ
jgi:hypothetical protein